MQLILPNSRFGNKFKTSRFSFSNEGIEAATKFCEPFLLMVTHITQKSLATAISQRGFGLSGPLHRVTCSVGNIKSLRTLK